MLRISIKAQTTHQVVLAVHGKLAGPAVALLAAEGDRHLIAVPQLVLELDGVPFIDRNGLTLLQSWHQQGLVLRGGSPFLQALLTAGGIQTEPNV